MTLLGEPRHSRSLIPATADYSDRRAARVTLVFVALCLGVVGVDVALLSAPLKLATADDVGVLRGLQSSAAHDINLLIDFSIGRFYAGWKFWFLSQVFAQENPFFVVATRTVFLVLPAASCVWFFVRVLRSHAAGALVAVLWLATFSFFPGYQAFFSNPLLLIGTALIFAAAACVVETNSSNLRTSRALALVLFSAALLMHEVFLCFLAVIVWAKASSSSRPPTARAWLDFVAPFIVIAGVYTTIYVTLRHQAAPLGIIYDGAQFQLRPGATLNALGRFTFAAFPGFELVFNRATTTGEHFYSLDEFLRRFLANAQTTDVAVALVIFASVARLLSLLKHETPPRQTTVLVVAAVMLIFLPSLLIALTPKYQLRAFHRWPPYYYGALMIPFFWLLLVGASWRALAAIKHRSRTIVRYAPMLLAAAVAVLHLAIAAANRDAVRQMLDAPFM